MSKRSSNSKNYDKTGNINNKVNKKKKKNIIEKNERCVECNTELDGFYYTRCFFEDKMVCNYCFDDLYYQKHNYDSNDNFFLPNQTHIQPNPINNDTNKLGLIFTIKPNNDNKTHNTNNDPFPNLLSNILNQLQQLDDQQKKQDDTQSQDTFDISNYEWEWLGNNINNITDLIELGKKYDPNLKKRFNLNMKILNNLVEPLQELQNMIGLDTIKKIIFDQLIYYLQNLDDKNQDMLHTVIIGPPGVGKTQLTHIIAKIYNRLGFLKTDKVISVKRDDLIGEYIGHTAVKTRKVLEKALGGVLLIDEAYALASNSEKDFARESIDMINAYLSEHSHDLVCVIAGYKKPIYEKLLSQNEGLSRRFTHHFEIEGYTPEQLSLIFQQIVTSKNWILNIINNDLVKLIKQNIELFPNFGGDMLTLFACCKKTHSKRLLNINNEIDLNKNRKNINIDDIHHAIDLYKNIKEKHTNSLDEDKKKYEHMYI